jgi:hypothetical protein
MQEVGEMRRRNGAYFWQLFTIPATRRGSSNASWMNPGSSICASTSGPVSLIEIQGARGIRV